MLDGMQRKWVWEVTACVGCGHVIIIHFQEAADVDICLPNYIVSHLRKE
jgi:hypothetical protein